MYLPSISKDTASLQITGCESTAHAHKSIVLNMLVQSHPYVCVFKNTHKQIGTHTNVCAQKQTHVYISTVAYEAQTPARAHTQRGTSTHAAGCSN